MAGVVDAAAAAAAAADEAANDAFSEFYMSQLADIRQERKRLDEREAQIRTLMRRSAHSGDLPRRLEMLSLRAGGGAGTPVVVDGARETFDRLRNYVRSNRDCADGWPPGNPKPGQDAVLKAWSQGRDVAAVMPTGGGKSLCFELVAWVAHHKKKQVTIVITMLRELVRSQFESLVARFGAPFVGMFQSEGEGDGDDAGADEPEPEPEGGIPRGNQSLSGFSSTRVEGDHEKSPRSNFEAKRPRRELHTGGIYVAEDHAVDAYNNPLEARMLDPDSGLGIVLMNPEALVVKPGCSRAQRIAVERRRQTVQRLSREDRVALKVVDESCCGVGWGRAVPRRASRLSSAGVAGTRARAGVT